jgi:putative FmdB family regulatory protein
MPVYEYGCADCGSLTVIRPLNLSFEPHHCPGCGQPAARADLTMPAIAGRAGARCVNVADGIKPALVIAAGSNVKAFPRKPQWMISS